MRILTLVALILAAMPAPRNAIADQTFGYYDLDFEILPSSSIGCPVASEPIVISVATSQGTFSGSGTLPTCSSLPVEPGIVTATIAGFESDPNNLLSFSPLPLFRSLASSDINLSFQGDVAGSVKLGVFTGFSSTGGIFYEPSGDGVSGSYFVERLFAVPVDLLVQDLTLSIPGVPDFTVPFSLDDTFAPVGGSVEELIAMRYWRVSGDITVDPSGTRIGMRRAGRFGRFRGLTITSGLPDGVESVNLSAASLSAGELNVTVWNPLPIPEPSTVVLLGAGLAILSLHRGRGRL